MKKIKKTSTCTPTSKQTYHLLVRPLPSCSPSSVHKGKKRRKKKRQASKKVMCSVRVAFPIWKDQSLTASNKTCAEGPLRFVWEAANLLGLLRALCFSSFLCFSILFVSSFRLLSFFFLEKCQEHAQHTQHVGGTFAFHLMSPTQHKAFLSKLCA